ncbi:hypothetical protein YC2023_007620 [Brassica napus]
MSESCCIEVYFFHKLDDHVGLTDEVRRISEQQRGGSHFLGCTSFTGHCGAGAVGDIFSV